jgi:hypothetical protein
MRFIIGNAPEIQRSAQVSDGWQPIPSLGAKRIQNYGLLVAGVGAALVALTLQGAIQPSGLWTALLILVIAIPVHELIHALATPGWGLTDRTVIGFQGGKGLFLPYMTYAGSLPLWRMLLIGLAPTLLLSILPLVLISLLTPSSAWSADLGFLAFFNMAISGGDLVNLYWISTHVPLWATVQADGWGLLWKEGKEA